jgi:hypothetical protein
MRALNSKTTKPLVFKWTEDLKAVIERPLAIDARARATTRTRTEHHTIRAHEPTDYGAALLEKAQEGGPVAVEFGRLALVWTLEQPLTT